MSGKADRSTPLRFDQDEDKTESSGFRLRLAVLSRRRHLERMRQHADCLLHTADQVDGINVVFGESEHRHMWLKAPKLTDELILFGVIEGVTEQDCVKPEMSCRHARFGRAFCKDRRKAGCP